MKSPHLLIGITAASAAVALSAPSLWVKIPALGVGSYAGVSYLSVMMSNPGKRLSDWQAQEERLKDNLELLSKQLAEKQSQLIELVETKNRNLAELNRQSADLKTQVEVNRQRELNQLNADITKLRQERIGEIERQAQEREQEASDRILAMQAELARIQAITDSELDAITTERQAHIDNLNHQIEELNQLLDEQLSEIDQREEQLKQQLMAEIEEYKAAAEAELESKRQQLEAIAQDDEAWLEAETQKLTDALEADKAAFLEKHKREVEKLSDRVSFLEQELAAALWQLDQYEKPQLPEGIEQDQIAARRCIELLSKLGVLCDYRGSWLDTSYIYVRIRPRTGGEKEIKKHLNRLHIELNLAEPPKAETVPGAVQLYLRPRVFLPMEQPDTTPPPAARQPVSPPHHPEVPDQEAIATLNASYLQDFVEPEVKAHVFGGISQLERDWINYLWNYHSPRPIRNQKAIIFRVWGKKSGDGSGFINARERLRRIAQQLGIDLRRKGEE
jgi:hypothetical protein